MALTTEIKMITSKQRSFLNKTIPIEQNTATLWTQLSARTQHEWQTTYQTHALMQMFSIVIQKQLH